MKAIKKANFQWNAYVKINNKKTRSTLHLYRFLLEVQITTAYNNELRIDVDMIFVALLRYYSCYSMLLLAFVKSMCSFLPAPHQKYLADNMYTRYYSRDTNNQSRLLTFFELAWR